MQWDFVVQIGDTPPPVEPDNVLKTDEANKALHHAYEWARSKADSSWTAANAKVYIEAIEMNRTGYETDPDRADYVQLLYIISNLTHWRGDHAKESRKVLREYAQTIK